MHRELTRNRKRFHKNTHSWIKIQNRKIILAATQGKNGQNRRPYGRSTGLYLHSPQA